ncbi:Sexual development regulator velC [Apiospora arundinis]|uniref:Sexual development regulator velC n=1 Tax=Apiospora arundinis TaxID=335852 RepID=A0ABR2J4Z2_9PEZI
MVDSMARPYNSWAHEPYPSNEAPYYRPDSSRQSQRLPPSSSFVSSQTPAQSPQEVRETVYKQSPYAVHPAAPAPAHHMTPRPLDSPSERQVTNPSGQRPPDIYARLSPTYSSSASDQTGDAQDPFRPLPQQQQQQQHPSSRVPPLTPPMRQYRDMPHTYPHPHAPPPPLPLPPHSSVHRPLPGPHGKDLRIQPPPQAMNSPSQSSTMSWSPNPSSSRSDRMKISQLVDAGPTTSSSRAASKRPEAPRGAGPGRKSYRLKVRQQPMAARSCGFGERDRRVVDPPPIVQLFIDDPDASPEEIKAQLKHPFAVVHATIWNETGEQDCSAMPEDYRQQRRLMGTVVASPFVGNDEKGEEGCFFCFADLSVRTPGSFRLRFSIMFLDPTNTAIGHRTPICAITMSDVFTVYNAKDFPGMQASTALTKRLKDQGCLISIKKGSEKTGGNHGRDDSDDDDDGDDSDGRGKKPKRQRR